MTSHRPLLVVFAGLPGTGKTTISRLLAGRLQAAYLRTDVIVTPMLRGGLTEDAERAARVGYDIARDVATENLRNGVSVVVDGVNASHERRALWQAVAETTGACLVQLETTLLDGVEHRRRVDIRRAPGSGHIGPTWEQIRQMRYDAWDETTDGPRLLLEATDTHAALAACLAHLRRRAPA